jgi:sedoheptulokinase
MPRRRSRRPAAAKTGCVLGIDVGTTSIGALLYDVRRQAVVAACSRPGNAFLTGGHPGHREQDCGRILRALRRVLTDLAGRAGGALSPEAVAVTGQMHGFVLLDGDRKPVTPLITWQDERCLEAAPDGRTWFDHFRDLSSSGAPRGMPPAPGFMAVTAHAMAESGQIPAGTCHVALVHDWIVSELAGRKMDPVTDHSFAQSSGLLLEREKRWDMGLAEAAGIAPSWLPALAAAGSVVGRTARTGFPLPAVVPIVAGLGDNQASVLAGLRHPEEELYLNAGTGGQVSAVVDEFVSLPGIDTRVFVDGRWLLAGSVLCGGRAFALLREFVEDIGRRVFGTSLGGDALYARLLDLSRGGASGVGCHTCFAGTREEPGRTGSFTGVTGRNFRIDALGSAVLDGIVREYHDLYRRMGIRRERLVGSGNGFRRNPVLQARAGARFGMPFAMAPFPEEACLGAALCAARGVGARDEGPVRIQTRDHPVRRGCSR